MGLYAAYGSNMDPAQMLRRCPSSPHTGTGWIRGWRLTFGGEDLGWEGALATIVEDPLDQVFVAVYDVTAVADGVAAEQELLADPPYAVGVPQVLGVLQALADGGWLAPEAVVVVERSSREEPWEWPTPLAGIRDRRYGEALLRYGRRS